MIPRGGCLRAGVSGAQHPGVKWAYLRGRRVYGTVAGGIGSGTFSRGQVQNLGQIGYTVTEIWA